MPSTKVCVCDVVRFAAGGRLLDIWIVRRGLPRPLRADASGRHEVAHVANGCRQRLRESVVLADGALGVHVC